MKIYIIINKITDKVYVGQTKRKVNERFTQHKYHLKAKKHDNEHLQNAWNKYGPESFEFYQLCDDLTSEEADNFEVSLISWYGELDLCYNLDSGGHKNKIVSPETREKFRLNWLGRTHTEETKEKCRQAKLGSSHTDATKAKISASNKGKRPPNYGIPCTEEQKQRLKEVNTGKKMDEETKSKISNSLKGRIKSEEEIEKIRKSKLGKKRSPETLEKCRITRFKNKKG